MRLQVTGGGSIPRRWLFGGVSASSARTGGLAVDVDADDGTSRGGAAEDDAAVAEQRAVVRHQVGAGWGARRTTPTTTRCTTEPRWKPDDRDGRRPARVAQSPATVSTPSWPGSTAANSATSASSKSSARTRSPPVRPPPFNDACSGRSSSNNPPGRSSTSPHHGSCPRLRSGTREPCAGCTRVSRSSSSARSASARPTSPRPSATWPFAKAPMSASPGPAVSSRTSSGATRTALRRNGAANCGAYRKWIKP